MDIFKRVKDLSAIYDDDGPSATVQESRPMFNDGGRLGFDTAGRVKSNEPKYVYKGTGPNPVSIKGKDNPNFKPLTKKEKEIARKLFKDEIKEYGSVERWAEDGKNYLKKSDIRRGRLTLDTKRTGVKANDPDRIRTVAKRGQDNISDVIFPNKEMKKKFLEDLDKKFSKPRGQGLQNADFTKKYPISERQVQRVINYYIKEKGLKYPKGDSTSVGSYKRRKDRYGDVTDLTIEDDISKKIKRPLLVERGMTRDMGKVKDKGVIDFAHRISKEHAKKLGIQFGTETTGFDSRLINQVIVRPSEIRLEKFYERQSNILNRLKSKGATKELIKEMDKINDLINKEVKKTSGRLIGVNIDPKTQEIFFTGQKKKFKLSNLNKTFKELKNIPFEERNEIFRKQIAKGIDAEIKRGFRPFDFKEILGDPKNRQTLLKYAKENAPDIFSKFKNILNNPMSKRRFALYSKLPAAAIPAGIVMSLADQSGKAIAADGTEARNILPEAAAGTAAGSLAFKPVRQAVGKGLKTTGKVLSKFAVPIGLGVEGYFAKQAYDQGKTIPEVMAQPFMLEGFVGDAQERLRMSPAERQALNRQQIAQDFSGMDSDFATPYIKGSNEVDVGAARLRAQREEALARARRAQQRQGIRTQGLAGGGIAKLAGDRSGPPPESGPNSQGLQGLFNRVKKL